MDSWEVLRELGVIERQRVVVQKSLCSEAMKAKLFATLDAKVRDLEKELEPRQEPAKRA